MGILELVQIDINYIKECELIDEYNKDIMIDVIDCCVKLFHDLISSHTCVKKSDNSKRLKALIKEIDDRIGMIYKLCDL
ncbi:MAG: hypothetical protein LBP63_05785 [Prevotellaceae bacterium]|jgi:hypothetical protein|nr:hypothetical protein [Prevotellaceae bacterium]